MLGLTARLAACVLAVLIALAWDIGTAGRVASQPKAPPAFRVLTGISGFLVAPALLAWIAGQSALTGHALFGLAWLWPLVTLLFVVQVADAMARRLVPPLLGAPLLAIDAIVAFTAVMRYAVSLGHDVPAIALVPGVAEARAIAVALGHTVMTSPLVVVPPLLAPALPARSRFSTVARTLLALGATAACVLVAREGAGARAGLVGYARLGVDHVTERDSLPFVVGLRILPELTGPPPAAAMREDMLLADSLGVTALHVRIAPEGCTPSALDSLGRALESYRRDSVRVIVSLGFPRAAAFERRASNARYLARRAEEIDRIVRRLKPDYLIPADAPYGAGTDALGALPVRWWEDYFTAMAAVAHRIRPATRVVLAASAAGARDSVLYAWASATGSPVDVPAFELAAARGGAAHFVTTLATADRWMQVAGGSRPNWVLVSAAPALEGEEAQRRAIRHVMAWASARGAIEGVVLGDASDYDRLTGFRTASGRLRRVTADVATMIGNLTGAPAAPPSP
jgi:hypothetical protein